MYIEIFSSGSHHFLSDNADLGECRVGYPVLGSRITQSKIDAARCVGRPVRSADTSDCKLWLSPEYVSSDCPDASRKRESSFESTSATFKLRSNAFANFLIFATTLAVAVTSLRRIVDVRMRHRRPRRLTSCQHFCRTRIWPSCMARTACE